MSMFRSCKNLLLSFGGFTILSGLLFQGNKLYINEETCNTKYNAFDTPDWQDYLEPENHTFKELIHV